MYWRMYSGHNCTNYAAYRMVKSGLANIRPWSGEGNASNWGVAMASITNGVPAVGAVAWWKANVPGAGSSGHVAYVEKVVSATEIIVSQDSWGGDFSWARLTTDGRGWPSGFIHFNDLALLNLAAPTVAGTAKVGETLAASRGLWSPSDATTRFIWRADGLRITGATTSALTLTEALLGKRISVKVKASKLGYPTATEISSSTEPVLPGVISNKARPMISGEARVNATLTATTGAWNPTPDTLTYQWLADGTPIAGADQSALQMDPTMVGKVVTAAVTARREGYVDVTAETEPTKPVAPGVFNLERAPTVTGTAAPGETLSLVPAVVTPQGTLSVQWLRGGVPVPGATGSTYLLRPVDLGSRISARIDVTRPGYTQLSARTEATARVRSTPRIRLALEPRVGRVKVGATVRARGIDPVTGRLLVMEGRTVLAELTIRDGTAAVRLSDLSPGRHTFRAVLPRSDTLERVVKERSVVVL
jgi:surface antigen